MVTLPSFKTLSGMLVSHVWFSDHSICYLELGPLAPGRVRPNGSVGNPVGEVTVFLGYDWLVKSASSKAFRKDLHENKNERDALVIKIIGATVESTSLFESSLEIEIHLSSGLTLVSFSTDDDGPDWNVGFNGYRNGWLNIEGGRLQFHTKKL